MPRSRQPPVTVANAINEGDVSPLLRNLGDVLLQLAAERVLVACELLAVGRRVRVRLGKDQDILPAARLPDMVIAVEPRPDEEASTRRSGIECDDGSCFACGDAVCLNGFYCAVSKSGRGCAWLPSCPAKPTALIARAICPV